MSKTFTYLLRVYNEDSDRFNVVYHPNFLKFMERARDEWAISAGHDFHRWRQQGIVFAIHSAQLDYLRPAQIYEQLEVVSTLLEIKRVSIIYDQVIQKPNDPNYVYCRGRIKIACLNDKMKPCLLPQEFVKQFSLSD